MLVSDWVSISKLDNRTYKPDIAMCIVVQKETSNTVGESANMTDKQQKLMKNLNKIYLQPATGIKKPASVAKK